MMGRDVGCRGRFGTCLEGRGDGRVFISRVFQFDHDQRQAIDKQNQVRPFVDAVFHNRKLVDRQKIVALGTLKINQPDQIPARLSVVLIGHVDSLGQHAVKGFVVGNEFRGV